MNKQLHPNHPFNYTLEMGKCGTIEMAEWCEENCINKFSGTDTSSLWLFDDEADLMAFKLRWM